VDRLNSPFLSTKESQALCEPVAPTFALLDGQSAEGPSQQERIARIVRAIESDIIPRLVRAHQAPAPAPRVAEVMEALPTPLDVATFVEMVLRDQDAAWSGALRRLRERGVSVESLYLGLLGPAASLLGTLWEEDRVSFSDVTVAVGRLQRIMRELSPAFGSEVDHPADGRRVLLVPAPGEQHTFGLTIVAEFFRRAGWEVVGGIGDNSLDPVAMVRDEWFDVVGISVGAETRLDWLRTGIAAMRTSSRNRGVGVMVGGPIFVEDPGRAQAVGADATATDGSHAPDVAEQLLDSRAERL
jgi:MerR family transcriptional regulator, light-induced transcriptional regulator